MSTWQLNRGRTGNALAYVRGTKPEAIAAAGQLANRLRTPVAVIANPVRIPKVGEIWRGVRGDRCRIVSSDGNRVTVLQLDTGHRVTSDMADFLATYKPPATPRINGPGRRRGLSRATTPRKGGPGKTGTSASGRSRPRSNPKGHPTTVREAIAEVIDAAKFPVVAKEVRSGKQDPVKSLEFVRRFMSTERQRSIIDQALRLARRFPGRLLDSPAVQNPPRASRRVRRAVSSGRFAKARHHAASSVTRGVRRLDSKRRVTFRPFGARDARRLTANPRGLERRYQSERSFRTALAKFTASGELVDWFTDDHGWVIRLRRIVPSGRPNQRTKRPCSICGTPTTGRSGPTVICGSCRRTNPKGRKYGAAPRSKGRIERKIVPQDYWIEPSTPEELAADPNSPYRMVTTGGQRFALSSNDAIRAQKEGLEFRPRSNQRIKSKALYVVGIPQGISGFRRAPVAGIATGARVRRDGLLPWSGHRVIVSAATFRMNDGHLPEHQPRGGIQEATAFLAANPFADVIVTDPGTRPNRRPKGRKVRGKGRSNPRSQDLARARRTFRHLNEIEPGTLTKVRGAKNAPKVAVKLGELVSLRYLSDKYAGSKDNPHGKTLLYEHTTRRPRPVLATDPGGKEVHIVGGRMHPTPDGLVN